MNRELMYKVADAIEQHKLSFGFNMQYWATSFVNPKVEVFDYEQDAYVYVDRDKSGHSCNTVGCIAGWVAACGDIVDIETGEWKLGEDWRSVRHYAMDTLDLTISEATALFEPQKIPDYRKVTPHMAAEVLRAAADGQDIETAWTNCYRMYSGDKEASPETDEPDGFED